MTRRIHTLCFGSAVWLMLGCTSFVQAADDRWQGDPRGGTTSGNWLTDSHWVDNTTPGNFDTATFDVTSLAYTVTFNADPAAIQGLTVSRSNVTFASNVGVSTLNV